MVGASLEKLKPSRGKPNSSKTIGLLYFWAWGGFAGQNPDHVFWEKGDDYTGDPAQEQQGLNSVFATDSTIEIIKAENRKLQN